ncbi:hypothetical protein JCM11491_006771 [Sporobolomyces phaffii]
MGPTSLFPVELPALTFESQTLQLVDRSPAAERLFRKRIDGGRLTTALDLLQPAGLGEGSEMELDRLREKLADFSNDSEQLPWGQTITLEYYPDHDDLAYREKADVLVSLRPANDSTTTYSILFVRPQLRTDRVASRSSSPTSERPESANSQSLCINQIPNGSDKMSVMGMDSVSSTPSVRSASFSSADKRPRPATGKEREKLPVSPETAFMLSHATARVRTDNILPASPQPTPAALRPLSPINSVSDHSPSLSASNDPPSKTSIASSVPPETLVLEEGTYPTHVVKDMHNLFTGSLTTTPEPSVTKRMTPALPVPPEEENGADSADEHADRAVRLPLTLDELTDLVEVQPQVCFFADAQGQVQWLNDAWYRYTNLDNRYHLPFEQWMSLFHPDDLSSALQIYLGAMTSGEPFAMEYRIKKSDGTMRWNVCHGRAKKDAEGKVLGWACSITDVEELVHARHAAVLTQERIKAVLEASQTLLISVNAQLKIDFLEGSLSLPDVLSSKSQNASLHSHLDELLHARELTAAAQKILDEEESEISLLHEFASSGGQKYYVRFRFCPILGDPSIPATSPDSKAVTGVTIVGINVTEAVRIEDELEKTRLEQVELESREKAKTDFLTTMSHELRTPTAQILGVLELVLADKEKPLGDSHRSLLEQAIRSGDALLELIGAVLDVRKVEAGELKLETQPFLLSEVVADARLFSVTSQAKGLTFEEEIGDFYQGTVLGDRLRLRQVLTNALSNAVKFTSNGGIVLRVQQTSETDTQLWIEVDILDSGVGIAENVLPTLFQPFRQAHAGTAREFGGTGLGLVIAKKLVELMNGRVELSSELGKGTRFKIFVPLAKAPLVDVKDYVGSKHHVPAATPHEAAKIDETDQVVAEARKRRKPQDVRVLLAEDNKLIREIVTRTLRGMKFHIDAVQDGVECLAQLERADYDLILMDGQMPRLDGYEATRAIRQDPRLRGIRIVALTASAISGDKERCLAAGMDSYLAKPVRANDLQRTIFEQIDLLDAVDNMDQDE